MNEGKVKLIIDSIKGRVGTDFQVDMNKILYEYWQFKSRLFESVSWFGGDKKNDGWVKDLALFYQIYSPRYLSEYFKKALQDKFSEDLMGLGDVVFVQKLWEGKMDEYLFVVNDKGLGLPEDSTNFYQTQIDILNKKYGSKTTHQILTINEIYDMLYEIKDTYFIDRLISKLDLNQSLEAAETTSQEIIEFLNRVADNIGDAYINGNPDDFHRISTDVKIEINHLVSHYEEIKSKLSKLTVVDKAFREINADTKTSVMFESVKNYFVKEYERLSAYYIGDQLYEEMLRITHDISNNYSAYSKAGELVLLYIFDRCDIFEKEERI